MNKTYSVGIAGLGTVGTGFVNQILKFKSNSQKIANIRISKIAVKNIRKKRNIKLSNLPITTSTLSLAKDKNIDIVETSPENLNLVNEANNIHTQVVEDAISALVNLGYNRSEVFSIVMKIKKEFTLKEKNKDFTVGNVVPVVLRALSGEIK